LSKQHWTKKEKEEVKKIFAVIIISILCLPMFSMLAPKSISARANIVPVIGSSHNSRYVYVLVNSSLWEQGVIAVRLARYKEDLEATGFGCAVYEFDGGTPEDIRAWLSSERSALQKAGNDLAGCLLVGNIPAAMYEMNNPDDNNAYEQFPIDLFYMDLDGTWTDSNHNGLYDQHTGNTAPDIWVGRLKADTMVDNEVSLIENYFDKDHAYRIGSLALPQRALVYVDDPWTLIDSAELHIKDNVAKAYVYADAVTLVENNATTCKSDYLNRLGEGWSFVDVLCHGNSAGHGFLIPDPSHPSSSVYEGYPAPQHVAVMGNPDVRNTDPHVFFYNLFVCQAADFTQQDYVGGWYIFTPTYGLAAVGSTKPGGMERGEDLFYGDLGQSFALGDAFRHWFSAWGEQDRGMYYGLTILGDPTLSLSGEHMMTINTPGLDSASNIVHYTKNGVGMTGSISGGTWSDECDHGTQLYIENDVQNSGTERYYTIDTHVWSVAEPLTYTVNYFHQFNVTITTTGLPYPANATVSWVENAISKQTGTYPAICDGNPFIGWCDAGSKVTITNPVNANGERFYSTSVTSWIVSSAFTAAVIYVMDNSPPVTSAFLSGDLGNNGWYVSDVAVTLSANDNVGGSGVAGTSYSLDGPTWITYSSPFTIGGEGTTTVYYNSTDNAGNVESTKTQPIMIDKTPPAITATTPANGATYILKQLVAADYGCSDAVSGLAGWGGPVPSGSYIDTGTVGSKSFTITATDKAGNIATKTVTYSVVYVFSGFALPLKSGGIYKAGSVVPAMFQLTDNGGNFVSTAVAHIWVDSASNPGASSGESNNLNSFRYDPASNQYIFNLSTKGLSAGSHKIIVTLDDGTTYSIAIKLK